MLPRISRRTSDDCYIDREDPIEEPIFILARSELDYVFGGGLVDLAAFGTRVDKRADAYGGHDTRAPESDIAIEVDDDTLGKVVGLDFLVDRELLDLGNKPVVTTDCPGKQPVMSEMVESSIRAIPLSSRPCECQVGGRTIREKTLFDRDVHGFGDAKASPHPDEETTSPSRITDTASAAETT